MSPALEASGVAIDGRLQPTDLELQPRTLTALIGPNGGGKTSLLRAVAGIDRPRGQVWVRGEELARAGPSRRRQLLSFLPAARTVAWPIRARDLIALGLDRPDPRRVDELLTQLDLQQLADRPADRLSTGERARVLLARALAPRPELLLLDEPLSNLDPYWLLRTMEILRDAVRSGSTGLVALHDLSLLGSFDRAILMGGGCVLLDDEPQRVLADPTFERVFRVRPAGSRWEVSPAADPRSSP